MGIRFFCPNGHRIHVKSALAGKKGFCPDCGEKVRIPMESDPDALRKKPVDAAETNAKNVSHGDQAVSLTKTVGVSSAPVEAGPPAKRSASDSRIDLRSSDSSIVSPNNGAAKESGPPAALSSKDNGEKISSPSGPDPIDENPSAQWYVRPLAGGQFGPAKGLVLKKWLGEGRVGADSYVWREGWTDWRVAGELFPGLPGEKASDKATPPAPGGPSASTPAAAVTTPSLVKAVTPSPRAKKKGSQATIWIVVGLVAACVILGGVLAFLAFGK